jgi:hypothetical protein
MKFSEMNKELQEVVMAYTKNRFSQIIQEIAHWGENSIKYLMIGNAGSAVATLTFMGSSETVRAMLGPKLALGCFIIGVVFVGLLLSRLLYGAREWYGDLNQDAHNFYMQDKLDWETLYNNDQKRSGPIKWADFFAWIAAISFFVGLVIGFISLLTYTPNNEVGNISG